MTSRHDLQIWYVCPAHWIAVAPIVILAEGNHGMVMLGSSAGQVLQLTEMADKVSRVLATPN
jgi:hypothetical protein